MVLIQLLLPTTLPSGALSQDATAALADTRRELAKMFNGLTAYVRSPAKGFVAHSHAERNHQGIGNELIQPNERTDSHGRGTSTPTARSHAELLLPCRVARQTS